MPRLSILTTVLVTATLLAGCAASVKRVYSGEELPDSEIATIESVGDVGFRIDRTIYNMKPAPYVQRVNGTKVGSRLTGFPTTVKLQPGRAELDIYCILPFGSAPNSRPPNLFSTVETYSEQTISAMLSKGITYELHCETGPGYSARVWLQPKQK